LMRVEMNEAQGDTVQLKTCCSNRHDGDKIMRRPYNF